MTKAALWWRAARPFSFSASATPAILGGVMALALNPGIDFRWLDFFLAIIGSMLVHSGANILSDYYDFRAGVDREGTYGSSGVLVEGLMQPRQLVKGAIVCFLFGIGLALYFILTAANPMLFIVICALSLVSAIVYTAAPVALKYHGLGDLQVFLFFGIMITSGAYYVQTQVFSWTPVIFAIPIGLLVDAILHSNNLRDIENDSQAGIATLAIIIGERAAQIMYYLLVFGAYISIIILTVAAGLHPIAFLTFLSLPLALKLVTLAKNKRKVPEKEFAFIDVMTAQLHMSFGVLFIISFVIQKLLFSKGI